MVIKRYFIGKFIDITFQKREMFPELCPSYMDPFNKSLCELPLLEMILKHLFGVVPEIFRNNSIYASVANDGKLPVFNCNIKQNSVMVLSCVHSYPVKNPGGPVKNASPDFRFDMNPYFSGGLFFGLHYCSPDLFLLFFCKECRGFDFH